MLVLLLARQGSRRGRHQVEPVGDERRLAGAQVTLMIRPEQLGGRRLQGRRRRGCQRLARCQTRAAAAAAAAASGDGRGRPVCLVGIDGDPEGDPADCDQNQTDACGWNGQLNWISSPG